MCFNYAAGVHEVLCMFTGILQDKEDFVQYFVRTPEELRLVFVAACVCDVQYDLCGVSLF